MLLSWNFCQKLWEYLAVFTTLYSSNAVYIVQSGANLLWYWLLSKGYVVISNRALFRICKDMISLSRFFGKSFFKLTFSPLEQCKLISRSFFPFMLCGQMAKESLCNFHTISTAKVTWNECNKYLINCTLCCFHEYFVVVAKEFSVFTEK